MKKIIAALAVLIGIAAFGSAVSAEQLPFEHCVWTKASGRTVCSTVMPDGTIIPHRSIDGYALRECGLFLQRAVPTPIETSDPGIEVAPE